MLLYPTDNYSFYYFGSFKGVVSTGDDEADVHDEEHEDEHHVDYQSGGGVHVGDSEVITCNYGRGRDQGKDYQGWKH